MECWGCSAPSFPAVCFSAGSHAGQLTGGGGGGEGGGSVMSNTERV